MTASALLDRYSVYSGRATNWPMVLVSAALVAPLIVMAAGADGGSLRDAAGPIAFAAAVVVVNLLTGTSIRTTAGPNGISVRFGVLGWPRARYALDDVERAEVVDLPPWSVAHGFWWTPRLTNCTVRSGPTLRLKLHSGRVVMLTVPQPHEAVSAITAGTAGGAVSQGQPL